jgi:2-polyprenyl-3-methyl-5-hydroxy-6-metoxy-1,4-benzoquinol methylase
MKEVLICPICQSTKFDFSLNCKDYTVSHEIFTIARCVKCNFKVTSPAPENQDLGNYYNSNDYISHTSKSNSFIDSLYLLARTYTLNWKIRVIKKAIPNSTEVRILDYGCGTGEFLQKCKSNGWQIEGIEPSEHARIKAQLNCNHHIAPTIDDVPTKEFNIISLWHVLEHVPELNSTLSALHNKLQKNGRLLVALPNPNALDAQHYKTHWAAYDVPRHLWHFNQENIERLLLNNGFTVVSKVPMPLDAFYVSLLSEKYLRNGKTKISGIAKAILTAVRSNRKARSTKEYSSIIYIAKK